nr:hypothetical protein [Tanacetum cinerariifolium]
MPVHPAFVVDFKSCVPTKERVEIGTTNVTGTNSYEFYLANKKFLVDAEVFWKILDICPRVQGEYYIKVPDDESTITFLIDLGYKGPLYKHPSMFVDHMHQPWRALAANINKCLCARQVHATHERIVTESNPRPARRRQSGLAFKDTSSVSKKMSLNSSQKLNGVPDESTVTPTTLSKGTGTKPGVLDEEKVTSEAKANVTLDWGSEEENEYTEEDDTDDEEIDDEFVHREEHIQDDDEETDDEFAGDEQVNDEEMANAEEPDTGNGDEEITGTTKANDEKTEEVKGDIKKVELPPTENKELKKTPTALAQSTSHTQSSLQEAESFSEYEVKNILFEKMDKSRSYLTHDKHQALYDALFNSLCLDDVIVRGQADPKKIVRKGDQEPVEKPAFEMASYDVEQAIDDVVNNTKAARYEIVGIEEMVPMLWSATKVGYDKDAENGIKHCGDKHQLCVKVKKLHGYGHLEEIMVRRVDRQLYKFKECNFVDLHLNNIEDMIFLIVQHKLFQLDSSNIVDIIMALRMFTRSLIIKRRVKDLQLSV